MDNEGAGRPPEAPAITAADVARLSGGRVLLGPAARTVGGFSIDTRSLRPGDLFFALRGERFDGHAFVADAMQAGACGAVVDQARAAPIVETAAARGAFLIGVGDTIGALQALAREVRRASGARVVAITGSAGKTTTKEAAAELLAARYRVFRNPGNLNNHIGLPLSLLELRHRPEIAVVELGMNHAGEIRTLVGIAEPEVRVWTNVSEVHAEFFASIEAIADAKAEILDAASPGHLLVANADDARVMARASRFAGRVVTFGMDRAADVRAREVRDRGLAGSDAVLETPAGSTAVSCPLLGRGNLANVLAATAVALEFRVPLAEIGARIATLRPAPRRGAVVRLARGVTLVDDSYNSNPAAVRRALDVLRHDDRHARRVAVLGEMLELGERAIALHEECGRAAAEAGLQVLITVGGPPAEAMARAAIAAGMSRESVTSYPGAGEAAEAAPAIVRPGDLVLVKGSRGIRTDLVVDRLTAELA